MMAVSLAVTFVLQEMDANSTRRVWGALDFFRSQVERVSNRNFVDIAALQLREEVLRSQRSHRRICPVSLSWLEPHPPNQVGESRVAADWIPHRLVFIKGSDRSRCQATFQPRERLFLLVQGRIDFGDPM